MGLSVCSIDFYVDLAVICPLLSSPIICILDIAVSVHLPCFLPCHAATSGLFYTKECWGHWPISGDGTHEKFPLAFPLPLGQLCCVAK